MKQIKNHKRKEKQKQKQNLLEMRKKWIKEDKLIIQTKQKTKRKAIKNMQH